MSNNSIKYFLYTSLLIIASCAASGNSLRPIVASKEGSLQKEEHTKKAFITKEYTNPSYSFKQRRYVFKDKNLLSKARLGHKNQGYYYRVSYARGSDLINRVDEYNHHELISSSLYKYDKSLVEVRRYSGKGRLFIVELYKDGLLFKRRKISKDGHVAYVSTVQFIKKGMSEIWYDTKGSISYVIHYSRQKRALRYAYYKRGLLSLIIDFTYNKKGALIRQDYYNNKGLRPKYVKFSYDKKGYLKSSSTHKSKGFYVTSFGLNARESSIKEYDNNGKIKSNAVISYSIKGIKNTKWFNRNSLLIKSTSHTKDNRLIDYIEYGVGEKEQRGTYNIYKKGYRLKEEIYELGNLVTRRLFNSNEDLEKEELFNDNGLSSYFVYSYDDKKRLLKKEQFSKQGYYLKSFTYSYDKQGNLLIEKLSEKSKTIATRYFGYDKHGFVVYTKIFDYRNRLVKRELIDSKGRVYKVENGVNGLLDNIVLYRFRDGRVSQEEHYNKYNSLIRVLTFLYSKDGRIAREDGFDSKKQYLGSIIYDYDRSGRLISQIRINHLKKPYERVYFDGKTGRVKSVNKLGKSSYAR